MKLVTIQHKEVLEIINSKGFYEVDSEKLAYKRLIPNYKVMQNIMNKHFNTNNHKLPIWCYYKIEGDDPVLDLSSPIYRYKGTSGLVKNTILLELNVPKDEILLTDYYSWTDYLFYHNDEYDEITYNKCLNNLKDYSENSTVQATIFKITKDMIVSTHTL